MGIFAVSEAHILWLDWAKFWIVCSPCHGQLLPWQWKGRGGEEWTATQKAEVRILSRLWRQLTHHCEVCGNELATTMVPLPLRGRRELQRRYRLGQRHFEQIQLAGDDLSALSLREASLMHANLNGSRLVGAELSGCILTGASLIGADCAAAHLQQADLSGAELVGANLNGSNLQQARLIGGDLRGASLHWANLEGAHLRGALIDAASLRGARLGGTVLPDGTVLD